MYNTPACWSEGLEVWRFEGLEVWRAGSGREGGLSGLTKGWGGTNKKV